MDHAAGSDAGEHVETLTQAFQGILGRAGVDVDLATVSAVLGVAFLTCASDRPRQPRAWAMGCRDLQLLRQAALFGVRLRDLHPPDAAVGLEDVGEFALHFQDSYVPLIRRALEAGQAVLAWQGWPEPFSGDWGLITAAGGGPYALRGRVGRSNELTDLERPPIQCYVVEDIEPRHLDAASLAAAAIEAASTAMSEEACAPGGWVIGPRAYDVWMAGVRADAAEPSWSSVAADHVRLAKLIAANRRTAARFFAPIRASDAFDARSLAQCSERAAAALEQVAVTPAGIDPGNVVRCLRDAQAADAGLGRAAAACLNQISAIK